jgi:hypothetical protein
MTEAVLTQVPGVFEGKCRRLLTLTESAPAVAGSVRLGVELLDVGVTQRQSLARNHRGPDAIPHGTRGGDPELSDAFEE